MIINFEPVHTGVALWIQYNSNHQLLDIDGEVANDHQYPTDSHVYKLEQSSESYVWFQFT